MRKWLKSGIWAILDQGAYAGTNFLVAVLLARWLDPDDYGAFATGYALFILLFLVHTALVLEPFTVFHPGRYKDDQARYLGVAFALQTAVGVLCAAVLALMALIAARAGFPAMVPALIGAAVAAPCVYTLWFLRRTCYVHAAPHLAALASLAYLVLTLAALVALEGTGRLDVTAAFVVLGLAALPVALWLAMRCGVRIVVRDRSGLGRAIVVEHLGYARWTIGAHALIWLRDNVYYLVLPLAGGLEASASFRALINLVSPVSHLGTALTTILMPALVPLRGTPGFARTLGGFLVVTGLAGVAAWAVLAVFHAPLVALAYGGRYLSDSPLLGPLGLVCLLQLLVAVLMAVFLAMEAPRALFRAMVAAVPAGVAAGVALVLSLGLEGAAYGLPLSFLGLTVAMVVVYRKERHAAVASARRG